MLQQILEDMYIDPEILAELSEDQTQVLYFKMREEQIRRHYAWSAAEDNKPVLRQNKHKAVGWKHGADGNIWVWVMGEHNKDKSYLELLDEAQRSEASRLAEEELQEQRKHQEELERKFLLEEEAKHKKLKEEEERLTKVKQDLKLKWRKAEEAALYATLKEARLAKQQEMKLEQERQDAERREKELRDKENALRVERESRARLKVKQDKEFQRQVSQRSEDIYMSASQVMADQVRMVQNEKDKVEQIWQVQLRKTKIADKERALVAKRARDEVRKSRQSQDLDGLHLDDLLQRNATINKNSSRASLSKKPASRSDVITWYKQDQLPKGTGLRKGTRTPEIWFHGCINRNQAADLLLNMRAGSFLVRLSEKVWGYALSYKDDRRVKHFLIDASGSNYQFFGTDQYSHRSLGDLVNYHKGKPITITGEEILTEACGQSSHPPDYQELM